MRRFFVAIFPSFFAANTAKPCQSLPVNTGIRAGKSTIWMDIG